jgi:formylmethanofuran dehydrogenase subunit E|tara:strand:- start:367 stop:525 length:159 start_codon:yes stop_codon:yes gene_type:complete
MNKTWNSVWREVHRSPTRLGHRIFECKHCYATKTTKQNIPKRCEFCGEKVIE